MMAKLSNGKIVFDGSDITMLSPQSSSLGAVRTFSDCSIPKEMSVFDNVLIELI